MKLQTFQLKGIRQMARQYLSIPGTSVPSERIFSATGLLVNKLRNRLSSRVIFLNNNYVIVQM
jgi:hypothetical protein